MKKLALAFLISLMASAALFADAGVLIPRDKQQPDAAILSLEEMEAKLRAGYLPIVLNSMRHLHDDRTAHWFVVTAIDAENVYVNDPWVSRKKRKTARDMTGVPIPRRTFERITAYGPKKERAVVLVRR